MRVRSRTSRKVHRENQSPFLWTSALLKVDDPPHLGKIVTRVGLDLILGKLGAGLVAARGVANQCRIVADDDDGGMAQLLELAQLSERDRMSKMDVDASWVDAVLDAKRAVFTDRTLELFEEFGLPGRSDRLRVSGSKADGQRPAWLDQDSTAIAVSRFQAARLHAGTVGSAICRF